MAFLFGPGISKHVSLCIHSDAHVKDEALLNEDIWKALAKPHGDKFAVSVTTSFPSPDATRKGKQSTAPWLKSLTCWTRPRSDVTGLGIPGEWPELYPELFGDISSSARLMQTVSPKSYRLIPVEPVPLSEIILVAESTDSYNISKDNPEELKSSLCAGSRIFRRDSIISFAEIVPQANNHDAHEVSHGPRNYKLEYRYRVFMTEPTLQGYALLDSTRFIVIPSTSDSVSSQTFAGDEIASSHGSEPAGGPSDNDAETLEIDESFLASSIVGPLSRYHNHALNNGNSNDSLNGDALLTTRSSETHRHSAPKSSTFEAETFKTGFPYSLSQKCDSECSIFLRTTALGRIGIFNGDWGVVESLDSSSARLARIFGLDEVGPVNGTHAVGSPILMSNIFERVSHDTRASISICSSVFGSRDPPIPTARVVTVARVASPYSIDRMYQPLFLRALKEYFDGCKRLVKKGDIIGVGIHTEVAKLISGCELKDPPPADDEELEDLMNGRLPLMSKVSDAPVFFKVTNLEYDILDTAQNLDFPDHYVAATMGELGCWIDPSVTRMVQTGVEHSRVPDISSYLGLTTDGLSFPPHDSSLLAPDQPFAKLRSLAEATLHPSAMDYGLQFTVLLKGSRGIGKSTVASWVARSLGFHLLEVNCFDIVGENDAQTEGTLLARFEKAASCAPCLFVLRHIEALARTTQVLETGKEPSIASSLRENISDFNRNWKLTGYPVLVFATSSEPDRLPASILSCFKQEIAFEAPTELQRSDILTQLLSEIPCSPDVSVKSVATQTAAMVAGDLVNLVAIAQANSCERAMRSASGTLVTHRDLAAAGVVLTGHDLDTALTKARISFSESIGAPKIPNVSWDDVGGLTNVKSEILDTIQLPLEHPELFADGLKKRSGILLYGPPGTGKTLLAKAVATSCSLNFFSVKGPELLNMYIGESEANVRRVFQRARDAKPCVIFFDELDSVAPKRGNHGDSGGVMDRIVSQLLAELDGMADAKSGADVFVIGATNRPDLLDPALLRPGRFDRMLYLGVSDDHQAQFDILEALTRKFRRDPDLDLMQIAMMCPFNYTGADFYALCSDAMLKAMSRKAEEIEAKIAKLNQQSPLHDNPHPLTPQYYLAELATKSELEVLVSRRDFEYALRQLIPSVSQTEMAHYAAVQQRFAKDTINALCDIVEVEKEQLATGAKRLIREDKGKGKVVE